MADYGVPQLRKRFFMVAHREGKRFEFPEPTHGLPEHLNGNQASLIDQNLTPYTTAWDAIGDLDLEQADLKARGRWGDLLPSIPEGQNYLCAIGIRC